jgi:hypothetical protein
MTSNTTKGIIMSTSEDIFKQFDGESFEFGIDFVDSVSKEQEVDDIKQVVSDSNSNLEHKLDGLTSHLDQLAAKIDFSESKELVEANAQRKVVDIVQLIVPLLRNLQKSPESDTIYWPGSKRVPMIDSQLNKMKVILDS